MKGDTWPTSKYIIFRKYNPELLQLAKATNLSHYSAKEHTERKIENEGRNYHVCLLIFVVFYPYFYGLKE